MITRMTWWRRVVGWVHHVVRGRFDSAPYNVLVNGLMNDAWSVSSRTVSRAAALRVPVVLKGRNMITTVATLPLEQRGPDRSIVPNPLLQQIDPDVPNVVTLAQTVEDLLFEAVSWWRVTARLNDGYPSSARRLEPSSVSVTPPEGRSPAPLPSGWDPRAGVIYVDGEPVSGRDVIRFDSPNPGICVVGGQVIRRAILLDEAARNYAKDPRPLDYFSPADGADPIEDDEAETVVRKWQQARRERATGWVPAAMQYNVVQSPTPADLQLVQLQQQASLELANLIGVDPEDVGVSTTSRTYANNNDRRRDRVNDVLSPYMRAITDRLSMGDVTRRGYVIKFDLDDFLRSNPTERWAMYEKAINLGVVSPEWVAEEEGWPASVVPAPAPAPVAPVPADASRLNPDGSLRFSGPRVRFTMPVPAQTFSVDTASRTVEGNALPYNETAKKGTFRYRFAPAALSWSEVSRVKLLRDHDFGQPLGKALALANGDNAFNVKFSVARGAAGDDALALAEDGVLDGFSVGVDFDDEDIEPQEDGTLLIRRATLMEVSLTAMPAFDGARVSRVAASQGGNMEECARCGQRHAPGAACATPAPQATVPAAPPTFTAEQWAGLMAMLPTGPAPAAPVAPADPGPAVVNPVRAVALSSVTEASPYRFDARGNIKRGSHEFSGDLYAASTGDVAAYSRALSFMQEHFDVDKADAVALNPTRTRPDMYVDQREYRYPVWQAIEKGSLQDSTPFVFPKFSSSSGLVANHTEAVEPTPGSFAVTDQTVTPTASSGKVEITRMAWDQGGNPQLSGLIWRQMLRAWYESLEAAAVAVLDAASPTQIDMSSEPGLADDDLDQRLTAEFAALQFVRGGFSMDAGFAQIDFFKALVGATDDTGRRLYPHLGPANANGQVSARASSVNVLGVDFLPAWALAATGTVAASSYMFDREVVHGWASAPQRLEFQYRVAYVDLAIWGYKAAAISDIAGVREIVYDPA